MNEKLLEKKLREEVKKLGGLALKFSSSTYTGMPDRIVLMPKGKIHFIEMKSTGKDQTPIQYQAAAMLHKRGFNVQVIDTQEKLSTFLDKIYNDL